MMMRPRRFVDEFLADLAMGEVPLLLENAKEGSHRGARRRVRQPRQHLRRGGFAARVDQFHDLALTPGELQWIDHWEPAPLMYIAKCPRENCPSVNYLTFGN